MVVWYCVVWCSVISYQIPMRYDTIYSCPRVGLNNWTLELLTEQHLHKKVKIAKLSYVLER